MKVDLILLAVLMLFSATKTNAEPKKKNLTVGYLTALRGDLKDRQGLSISGALTLALDEINNNEDILPNVNLVLRWNDTRGNTEIATSVMADMIEDGVDVFIGPEGPCYIESTIAAAENIPMISYKCSDSKASEVSTFARTDPLDTHVAKSVISLLRYYDWNQFAVIYEDQWKEIAFSLMDEAEQRNMTINYKKLIVDFRMCCENNLPCCTMNYWNEHVQDIKNKSRIFVHLGTPLSLVSVMEAMHADHLFRYGEYMFIFVDMNTFSPKEAYRYLWNPQKFNEFGSCEDDEEDFLQRARSLFVVAPTAPQPSENYKRFSENVLKYNAEEPFNFLQSHFLTKNNFQRHVSIYASHLYDAAMLYARALHKLLGEYSVITDEIIDQVASNGTKIIETIIGLRSYESVAGMKIQIDENGDSEGNFTVLALQELKKNEGKIIDNFTCDHQMRPVGHFLAGKVSIYRPTKGIQWPGDVRPNCKLQD